MHTLPEEQRELLAMVTDLCEREIAPQAAELESSSQFPGQTFERLAELDLMGLAFPADVGGSGLPYRTYLMVVEALARAHVAVGLGLSVHTLSTWGIEAHATPQQRREFVPPMVAGTRLGAYSLSEPGSGSDAASLATVAKRDGSVYRVSGSKAWVTHAGIADTYLVMVRTGDAGPQGISAFAIDSDQDGLRFSTPETKMGMRASPTGQLHFEDAPVDASRLIGGEEGRGFAIAMASLDGGRLGIAAVSVGLAQAALAAAIAYAKEREQFGQPIAGFQGVSFVLADMGTTIEAARALYLSAADLRDHGHDTTKIAAMSKLFASDVAMQVTTDAIQVLGGAGYVTDHPIERYFREAKMLQIVEGTNQIQRMVIGRELTT